MFIVLICAGCGGGGGSNAPGAGSSTSLLRSVTLSVSWPHARAAASAAGSRDLPESANSVVVTVTDSGGFSDSRLLTRPAAVSGQQPSQIANFFGLRSGVIQVDALAYTGTDGTGQIVDSYGGSTTVGAGLSGSATVIFNSVPFATVQISPAGTQTILQGQTYTVSASGLDVSGNLISSSPLGQWTSSNSAVATVGATTGIATGVLPGSATLTFTDSVYGKTASTTVIVQGGNSTVTIQ